MFFPLSVSYVRLLYIFKEGPTNVPLLKILGYHIGEGENYNLLQRYVANCLDMKRRL
jgi:hypothetical protein